MPLRTLVHTLFIMMLTTPAWSAPQLMKPFLDANCIDCHDSETHKRGLNLDGLEYDPAKHDNALTWEHVFDRVNKGEMPPKMKAQPNGSRKAERELIELRPRT